MSTPEQAQAALPAPSRPATFLLGARVVGGIIRRGYDDMHLIVEDTSGHQYRVVAHLADSDWRSAPWLLPVPDEHAKASEHEYDPMPPQEQGEHPPCRVCGRPFSEHAKASSPAADPSNT